jgi:NitT/TauT family transport system substrate-binding protein
MKYSMRSYALVPLLAAAAALAVGPASAAEKVSFGQVAATATGWPGMVAKAKGFFAANGIEWDVVSIGVSPGQQAVAAGSLNVMHNACNAVVSFVEKGGVGARLTMATMTPHPGVLVAKKGIKSVGELKGKLIGTSSIKSGSTVALQRLLKAKGLAEGQYDLVAGQGTAQIYRGLQSGALDAVWLVPPQSIAAAQAGFSVLGSFREVAPKFMFTCFSANEAWLKAKPDVAKKFAASWLNGVTWLHDPKNRAEAEKILAQNLNIKPDVASKTYDELTIRNPDIYPHDGKVQIDALRATMQIMVEGGELPAMPKGDLRRFMNDAMLGG